MPHDKLRKILMFFHLGIVVLVVAGLGAALTATWWMCFAAFCQVFAVAMLRRTFLARIKTL